jgi:hypothetical protein
MPNFVNRQDRDGDRCNDVEQHLPRSGKSFGSQNDHGDSIDDGDNRDSESQAFQHRDSGGNDGAGSTHDTSVKSSTSYLADLFSLFRDPMFTFIVGLSVGFLAAGYFLAGVLTESYVLEQCRQLLGGN